MIALPVLYAEGVALHSPGSPRSGAPWVINAHILYTEGVIQFVDSVIAAALTQALCNPFGVKTVLALLLPRVRCATLGCGVQPLRGIRRSHWFVPMKQAADGGHTTCIEQQGFGGERKPARSLCPTVPPCEPLNDKQAPSATQRGEVIRQRPPSR